MLTGLSLVLTGSRFDIPASAFVGRPGRWRYRDSSGLGSDPDGITSASLRVRRDGTYKVSVSGRYLEPSTFDGTSDPDDPGAGRDRQRPGGREPGFRRVNRDFRFAP
jgi:hypothetical protein